MTRLRPLLSLPFIGIAALLVATVLAAWNTSVAITLLLALSMLGLTGAAFLQLARNNAALSDRNAVMNALVGQAGDAIELTDLETLRFIEFNDVSCKLLGYTREEYAKLRVHDIQAEMSHEALDKLVDQLNPGDTSAFETIHRKKNGDLIDVHVSLSCVLVNGRKHVSAIWRDITQRRRREAVLALRHELASQMHLGDQNQLLRKALDAAESITRSSIGFLHFVEEDQQTVSLQVWSSNTLARMCYARGEGAHYPVSEAGVWVDCILQRRPVIHNDYASLPHRKGLPEGHAPMIRELTFPLIRNDKVVAVIGVGNKATEYNDDDIAALSEITELAFDFVERQRAEKQIEFIAYHDTLTGLPNRALVLNLISQAVGQCRRSHELIAVGYINLDGFKPINDSFGYAAGDELLILVANRLKESLRQGDALARIGGDEFVVMLTGLPTTDECERAMQRILHELNQPVELAGKPVSISGCIGATLFPVDDSGADALMHHAHHAMFQAKASGQSSFRMYDPVHDQQLRERRRIREEFTTALQRDQLVLYYQPKISLADGRVIGAEALVRWQHPQRGLLAPGAFLPQIENSPLDIQLGEWVIRKATAQLNDWLSDNIQLVVSINISPQHLQSPGFKESLESALSAYPQETARHLELEILEVAGIADAERTSAVMRDCKSLGIQFSLDDFGTGYSSLTHFHNLPIDIVKIDQNFVRGMLDRPADRDIVQGVLRLADLLKRPVVAEGVETIEIGLLLASLGCHYAQGYGIARPMPANQLVNWLSDWGLSSQWHQLPSFAPADSTDPDLDVAIFSHRNWVEHVLHWQRGDADAVLPELHADKCAFHHWYHGIGRSRYGRHPSYAFIPPKHEQTHHLAEDLIAATRNGDANAVERTKAALGKNSEELLALLRTLSGR